MMRTCMVVSSLCGTLAERIEAIADAGFDGLELDADDLEASGMSPTECASRCADHGLVLELVHLPTLALGGPSTYTGLEALLLLERGFSTMEELGARSVAIGAPPRREGDPVLDENSRAQVSSLFVAGMAAMAASHGVDCVIEARRGTQIADVSQAWRLIEDLEDPDLTLTLDVADLFGAGTPSIDVADLPVSLVGLVRVSVAPPDADGVSASLPDRFLPADAGRRVADSVAMMMSLGFDGAISVHAGELAASGRSPDATAQREAATLQALLAQADSVAEYAPSAGRYLR